MNRGTYDIILIFSTVCHVSTVGIFTDFFSYNIDIDEVVYTFRENIVYKGSGWIM